MEFKLSSPPPPISFWCPLIRVNKGGPEELEFWGQERQLFGTFPCFKAPDTFPDVSQTQQVWIIDGCLFVIDC